MSTGQELGSTGNDAFQLSVRFWTTTTRRDVLGQHLDGDVPPELRVTGRARRLS